MTSVMVREKQQCEAWRTCGQVTQEELQTAMGFLKEQLGEDELRGLLDRLNDWQQDGATPIDVAKLMQMAESAEPLAVGQKTQG
jgi:hypothetical protein